jgi:hypothetical protein
MSATPYTLHEFPHLTARLHALGGSRYHGWRVMDSADAPVRFVLQPPSGPELYPLGMTSAEAGQRLVMLAAGDSLPPQLQPVPDESLLTPAVAARVLSAQTGVPVSAQAVRHLCNQGELAAREVIVRKLERRIERHSLLDLIRRGLPEKNKGGRPRQD